MTEPLISVLMPSYNHEKFIGAAISSVLAQTLAEFELVIVDDGSEDASASIISEQRDPRVRSQILERNQGACHAMNLALQMSRGALIAVCNSDDMWHPEKLALQLRVMETLPRVAAVFSDVTWIGDDGQDLAELPPFAKIFQQRNRSRWSWLRSLLESGNCLCHPSILIKRETYDAVGLYDNRLRQLPDMEMWIRVLERFDIFVMPDKLVSFRMHASNTSMPSIETSRRDLNEYRLIIRKAFGRMPKENFIGAFGSKFSDIDDELDLRIEQAFYLLSYQGMHTDIFRELGLDILFDVSADADGRARLSRKFGFEATDFHRAMGTYVRGNREQPMPRLDPSRKLLRDRAYRIEEEGHGEYIFGPTDDSHRVGPGAAQGSVDEIKIGTDTVEISGWAVDVTQRLPVQTIVVFLGERFVGYGASSEMRPDVVRRLGEPTTLYAGFRFEFRQSGTADTMEQPRLFALSSDGQAAELSSCIEPIAINSTLELSKAESIGAILGGSWSAREPWGVWSDGSRASVIYDASALPESYLVAIDSSLYPPSPLPKQEIQVSDGQGNRLATLTNERPSGIVVVKMNQAGLGPRLLTSLIFEIDNPTSPYDLGENTDTRRLGIGLRSLTFLPCADQVSDAP